MNTKETLRPALIRMSLSNIAQLRTKIMKMACRESHGNAKQRIREVVRMTTKYLNRYLANIQRKTNRAVKSKMLLINKSQLNKSQKRRRAKAQKRDLRPSEKPMRQEKRKKIACHVCRFNSNSNSMTF